MGNFYVNYTLRGPSQHEVAEALAGRRAAVTPEQNGCVVFFDEASDSQDAKVINELASSLSSRFACPVLAVLNHDDDILWFALFRDGQSLDEYNSNPGYFDSDSMKDFDWSGVNSMEDMQAALAKMPPPPPPVGGDAAQLCAAFGSDDPGAVEAVLRNNERGEGGYVFAFARHLDLVQTIGLPTYGVGTAYASFGFNELPDGLAASDLITTE